MSQRSLGDWLAYISAQHPSTIALGLDRVQATWTRMQANGVRLVFEPVPIFFTVGGTNGKGSTCAILERILIESGYRVGLYTSPHLERYNERVRVNGEDVADAPLVAGFEAVEAARGDTPLTYFEYATLGALAVFARENVEAVILEVGLGGRLDAVNIIDADAAIVVSVDLDHQAYLGPDKESIGFEKAGIYRRGKPAIYGDVDPPRRLVDHAQSIGADLQLFGRDYRYEAHERQWDFVGRKGARRALPMPALRGRWQLKNASAALAALDEVADRLPVSIGEIKRGLMTVRLTGRLQSIPGRPSIVLDVAHNPQAARALADGLGDMGFAERTFAVFGILADKDAAGVIDAMKGRVDRWYVAAPESDRAARAADITRLLEARGAEARSFATITAALESARREAGPNDRITVFGSFYTVAEALRSVR